MAPGSEASPVLRVYGGIAGDALGAGGPNGVAYGDINGDGLDDLIVGAPGASPMSRTDAGEVVVIYGSAALPATQLDLVASPGTLGETHIVGAAAGNETGTSVAAADLNGDGFDDILIGASGVSTEKGAAYIIYGSASKPGAASGTGSVLDLSDAVGANGETRINGFQDGARLGNALAAGDVNGDGYDDLIIGSHYSDGTAGMDSGEAYIVYGGAVKPGTVALSGSVVVLETPGASGDTRIRADDAGDYLGESVTAGDINGDGYDDVIVGATGSNTAGSNAGEAFVIYGGSTKPGAAELSGSILDLGSAVGSNGETRIRGAGEGDGVAGSLASGDVNADGYDDLIIGAPQTEKPLPDTEGLAYVLYGAPVKLGTPTGSGSVVNFSDSAGSYGETRIIGAVDGMLTGSSVGAGDVNGDGFDDVVVGARFASPGGRTQAGTVSLVFGGLVKPGVAAGAGSVLDLASASPGVAVLGADVGGGLGFGAVAGGDMDSDGFSECVTAAPDGSPSSRAGAGYVAAVFGQGDAETAEASEAFAAGDTGLRGFGGRLSPTVRAWLSFADGAAGIATATLTRNNDGIAPFGGRADVVWNLSTTRTGYTEASIRLQYLDSEVAALDEETLRLMQAPAPEGPWSEVPDPLFSPSRNEVRANVSEFGYFTLQGVKNSVVVDTLTDVADGDTSSIAALLLDRGTDTFISLREAITAANNTAGHDEIIFAGPIAGGVILPGSALPALNDLDGATLRGPITIDGQDVVSPGITLAGFNELADLSVVRFLTGVYIFGESNLVQGCRIGVDASEAAAGNRYGIDIQNGQHNIIFGNVVSGNAEYGVLVRAGTAMGNTIAGNFIGVDSSGQVVIPNNVGIYVSDSANVIGPDNVVRGNITDGIQFLGPAFHNAITGNLITENGGAGIVLLDGANGGIQPPLIEALTEDIMPGFAAVSGSAAPNATVDFFADPDDEGVVHLGSATADGAGEFATLLDVSDVIGLNLTAIQTDGAGNSSAFSVPKAIDFTPPQIVLVGNGMISLQCGDPYVDPGATATDDVDGDISGGIVIDSLAVDTATLGDYLVTYNVTDAAGNAANQITRTVQVRDNTVPIIQLLGPSEITVACGEVYVDPGATASDSCAGDLSGGIVIGGSAVDTATLGDYLVTYNVTDAAGNAANQITRVVQVRDNTVPIIQLLGPSEITVACGEVYVDPGATASDSCAGDLSGGIVIGGSAVDTATPGDYIVTYNVTDVTGNVANQVNRTVHVVDITLPIITLNDSDDITINCGAPYTDAGVASATDECAGVLSATLFSSDVNTTTPGDYTVVYRATDGTNTVDKTRNVHVVDSTDPVITLNGSAAVNVECGGSYSEAGATASDACDGDFAATPSGTVDPLTPGDYFITYNAQDTSGNSAAPVVRTVSVSGADTAPPVIHLAGSAHAYVDLDFPFVEPGYEALDACEGDLTNFVEVEGTVDGSVPGDYVLTYSVSDTNNNLGTAVRTVTVLRVTPNRLHVSPDGDDELGDGSEESPLRTIAYAMQLAGPFATEAWPASIYLAVGTYVEDVVFASSVRLFGARHGDSALTVIEGTVDGAANAHLRDLTVSLPEQTPDGVVLLSIDDVPMVVDTCVFDGAGHGGAKGIRITGPGSSSSAITRCTFTGLSCGIETSGSEVNITRNVFDGIVDVSVRVLPFAGKGTGDDAVPTIGDVNGSQITGYNIFDGAATFTIDNQTSILIDAVTNYFGSQTERKSTCPSATGPVACSSESNSYVQPATVAVEVTDGPNIPNINDATVGIRVSSFPELTRSETENGTYQFLGVNPGTYRFDVSAPGYESVTDYPVGGQRVNSGDYEVVQVKLTKRNYSGDKNKDNVIDLDELLRIIQFYNSPGYSCDATRASEDGFLPGIGSNRSCPPHDTDYAPQDWSISLDELLRAIQFYNSLEFYYCPNDGTEDKFCPGAPAVTSKKMGAK